MYYGNPGEIDLVLVISEGSSYRKSAVTEIGSDYVLGSSIESNFDRIT